MTGILSHLTVVEGSAFVAAPLAGMSLAQLGATVIRFDPIEGGLDYHRWPVTHDDTSIYWAGLNKGKKSVALDVRRPEGQELAQALIASVGRFVTNFPARGWLDYERLKARRKDLIMVAIQGNADGSTALDYTVHSATGFAYSAGPADHQGPINQSVPAWDLTTGLHAAIAMLAAENHHQRTGEGQLAKIALSDVAFATLGHLGYIGEVAINHTQRPRLGNEVYGAFGKDFTSRDGKQFIVVTISSKQWTNLCEATGLAAAAKSIERNAGLDFARESDRFAVRDQLYPLFDQCFGQKNFDEIRALLDRSDVCWGPYQNFQQCIEEDPRVRDNPMFQMLHQPGIGDYSVPSSPINFSISGRLPPVAAPMLGQDTEEVLAQCLGLSHAQIGQLVDKRVVKIASPR